jgi:hypothetical protein
MKNKIFLVMVLSLHLVAANLFAGQHGHSYSTKTDCDINAGPCTKAIEHESIQVTLDIDPKPVRPMKDLLFSVILKEGENNITNARVGLDLTMPGMFMGVNRHVLSHKKDGRYEGKGIIPICPHGGKLWQAEVTIERDGRSASVSYQFEVR